MASESVQQDVFTVLHGQASPIVSRWAYRAADPFAISFSVRRSSDRWIEWLVARDLVIEGLTTPTGIGDIRMAPRRIDGYDVVELEIRSDGGSAVLEVDRDLLAQFVDSTLEIVDLGEEHDHLDIDGAIARLTGSAAGPTTPEHRPDRRRGPRTATTRYRGPRVPARSGRPAGPLGVGRGVPLGVGRGLVGVVGVAGELVADLRVPHRGLVDDRNDALVDVVHGGLLGAGRAPVDADVGPGAVDGRVTRDGVGGRGQPAGAARVALRKVVGQLRARRASCDSPSSCPAAVTALSSTP